MPATLVGTARRASARDHDVLRMKGFVEVAGKPMRLLVQGVGARFSHQFDRPWRAGEERRRPAGGDRPERPRPRRDRSGSDGLRHASASAQISDLSTRRRKPSISTRSPADIVALVLHRQRPRRCSPQPHDDGAASPSLRLAIAADRCSHPFSVDLYVEKVVRPLEFVLVRLLGGLDYWRYGVEELRRRRAKRVHLAIVPGDRSEDARLERASTLPVADLRQIWAYFRESGPENIAACLAFIATKISGGWRCACAASCARLRPFKAACVPAAPGAATAFIVFYRCAYARRRHRAGRGAGRRAGGARIFASKRFM